MDDMQKFEYAGFWIRFLATLIDTVLILVITLPIMISIYGIEYFHSETFFAGVWDLLISRVFPAIAVILFWIYRSATPGKMAVRVRIVDAKTGQHLTTAQSIGRYFAYFISMLPLMVGFIWIGFDRKKQGWHDKLAGTVVIKEKKLG